MCSWCTVNGSIAQKEISGRDINDLDVTEMTFSGSKERKGYSANSLGPLAKHLGKEKLDPCFMIRLKTSTRRVNILSLGMDLFYINTKI